MSETTATSTLEQRRPDDAEGAAALALSPGTRIGRYVVLDHLGAGGMGTVHSAWDQELQRKIAIKLVRPERRVGEGAEQARARFLREAQALAQVSHANVVAVFDSGLFGDEVFLAMELVEGRDLRQYLAELPPVGDARRWPRVLEIFREIARGLAAVHRAGLVHRDLKPANVMVDRDGRARVMDFGLARRIAEPAEEAAEPSPEQPAASPLDARLTHTGLRIGTPSYMSPEQFLGRPCDARSDVFALAVALYEALYGQRPFGESGENLLEGEAPAPPRGTPVPEALRRVVLRGLARDPEQRWPTPEALMAAADRVAEDRRRRFAVAAATALAMILGGLFFGLRRYQDQRCGGAEEELAAHFGPVQETRIEAAFAATGRPFAAGAAQALLARLADWGRSWTAQRRDACEATYRRGIQSEELLDRRVSCLDDRLAELDAAVSLLEKADLALAADPAPALGLLGELEACADLVQLSSGGQPPAPERRDALRQVKRQILGGLTSSTANRRDEGLAQVTAAASAAEQLGAPELVAESRLVLAFLGAQAGRSEEAEADWMAALAAAVEAGDDDVLARTGLQLARHYAEDLGQPRVGAAWMAVADAAASRLGHRPRLSANLALARATIATRGGDNPRALEELERALALVKDLPSSEELQAGIENDRGIVLSNLGRYPEASAASERAIALDRQVYGAGHPQVAISLNNLGSLYWSQGEAEKALALHLEAAELTRRSYGEESRIYALSINNAATALQSLGRLAEADGYQLRGIAIQEKILGPDHIELAGSLSNLAFNLRERGELEKALALYRRALPIFEKNLGAEHAYSAGTAFGTGVTLSRMGRPAEALPFLQRAYDFFHSHPSEARFRGGSAFQLAKTRWETGTDRAAARGAARQALADYREDVARFAKEIAAVEAWLAEHS